MYFVYERNYYRTIHIDCGIFIIEYQGYSQEKWYIQ